MTEATQMRRCWKAHQDLIHKGYWSIPFDKGTKRQPSHLFFIESEKYKQSTNPNKWVMSKQVCRTRIEKKGINGYDNREFGICLDGDVACIDWDDFENYKNETDKHGNKCYSQEDLPEDYPKTLAEFEEKYPVLKKCPKSRNKLKNGRYHHYLPDCEENKERGLKNTHLRNPTDGEQIPLEWKCLHTTGTPAVLKTVPSEGRVWLKSDGRFSGLPSLDEFLALRDDPSYIPLMEFISKSIHAPKKAKVKAELEFIDEPSSTDKIIQQHLDIPVMRDTKDSSDYKSLPCWDYMVKKMKDCKLTIDTVKRVGACYFFDFKKDKGGMYCPFDNQQMRSNNTYFTYNKFTRKLEYRCRACASRSHLLEWEEIDEWEDCFNETFQGDIANLEDAKKSLVELMNKTTVFIKRIENSWYVWDDDEWINRTSKGMSDLMSDRCFEVEWTTEKVGKKGAKTTVNHTMEIDPLKIWNKSKWRRKVQNIGFTPKLTADKYNNKYLNTYTGLGLPKELCDDYCLNKGIYEETKKGEGKVKCVLDHIKNIWCSGDVEDYEYMMNWLAHIVQKPHVPTEVVCILQSDEGTGKGRIISKLLGDRCKETGAIFEGIIGSQYGHTMNNFPKQFNAEFNNKVFVNIDEGLWGGDGEAAGRFKSMITEGWVNIEFKFKEKIKTINFLNFLISSNSKWVCSADSMRARRFKCFTVSNRWAGRDDKDGEKEAYFNAISDVENEVFGCYLYNRDTSKWKPRQFKINDIFKEQVLNSQDDVDKWVRYSLHHESIFYEIQDEKLIRGDWGDKLVKKNVYHAFCKYVLTHKKQNYYSEEQFWLTMRKIFNPKDQPPIMKEAWDTKEKMIWDDCAGSDGTGGYIQTFKRLRGFIMPQLDDAKEYYARHIGFKPEEMDWNKEV